MFLLTPSEIYSASRRTCLTSCNLPFNDTESLTVLAAKLSNVKAALLLSHFDWVIDWLTQMSDDSSGQQHNLDWMPSLRQTQQITRIKSARKLNQQVICIRIYGLQHRTTEGYLETGDSRWWWKWTGEDAIYSDHMTFYAFVLYFTSTFYRNYIQYNNIKNLYLQFLFN